MWVLHVNVLSGGRTVCLCVLACVLLTIVGLLVLRSCFGCSAEGLLDVVMRFWESVIFVCEGQRIGLDKFLFLERGLEALHT